MASSSIRSTLPGGRYTQPRRRRLGDVSPARSKSVRSTVVTGKPPTWSRGTRGQWRSSAMSGLAHRHRGLGLHESMSSCIVPGRRCSVPRSVVRRPSRSPPRAAPARGPVPRSRATRRARNTHGESVHRPVEVRCRTRCLVRPGTCQAAKTPCCHGRLPRLVRSISVISGEYPKQQKVMPTHQITECLPKQRGRVAVSATKLPPLARGMGWWRGGRGGARRWRRRGLAGAR